MCFSVTRTLHDAMLATKNIESPKKQKTNKLHPLKTPPFNYTQMKNSELQKENPRRKDGTQNKNKSTQLKINTFQLSLYSLICRTMAEYKVELTTGNLKKAGTWDHIFVTLFGSDGQSERTEFNNWGLDFMTGGVSWKHAACFLK